MTTRATGFVENDGTVTMASLTGPLSPLMSRLDAFLLREGAEFEPEVRDMVDYAFAHSGKRLRPILVFFAGWGAKGRDAELVKAAAIVEMVHLATLVHDDLLDSASLRHGAPTLVAKYGAHASVLVGDAMFSEALRLAATFDTTEVCRVVALATRRVCAGEIGQTFARGDDQLSLEKYNRVIELKTAELFRASCRLGALAGGESAAFADAADVYGMHLGTAYQIFDDVADLVGDEKKIGKTLGTDLASGKFTLPLLLLLEGLSGEERKAFARRLAGLSPEEMRALFTEKRILPRVREAFHAEVGAAVAAIAPFGTVPGREPLTQLAVFVSSLMAGY